MRDLQNISIQHKQTLIIMLTSSVALLLACAAFIAYDTVTFRRDLVEDVSVLASAVGENCAAAIDFNDPTTAAETLTALHVRDNIISACVYSRDGRVFAVYQRDHKAPFAPPPRQAAGEKFTGNQLDLFRPIEQKGEMVGTIFVASNLKGLSARLAHYTGIVAAVFLISLLASLALSSRLQRLVSHPILQLAQVARLVALEKNYSLRANKLSQDEIGQLVDRFNEMLAQIQQRDAALQGRTAELAESQSLYHSLVDQMPAGIFRKNAEGRFVFVNSRFCRIKGLEQNHILGKMPGELATGELAGPNAKPPEAAGISPLAIQDANHHELIMETGQRIDAEEQYPDPDGKIQFWQVLKSPVFGPDGKITGTQGIFFDITERKQLEAQLFRSQKMETVGKLAGGIAHEFNSILTAIIGQSELMLGDLAPGNPLTQNATEIRKAAERAAILTRQLLAYGRKQILQPDNLDLNAVIFGMENTLRHLMGPGVEIRFFPAPGLKSVRADAGQIEHVIVSLLMNAAEAMPNGGKLTLETASVTLDADYVSRFPEMKAGPYVMLAITDTGTGMGEEVKARLFEPFFTTKAAGKATGLGLAMCHGILKQSGGNITVYSELGRGTTFKVYLPQIESEIKPPAQPKASPESPRGMETILLVEDDPSLRGMAGELLARLGYTIFMAGNGVEAMSLVHQQGRGHIDLLFTDVVMPHMNGKELADRIKAVHPQMKVLFTSAYTGNAFVHQGVLDEGVALLQKPFTPSALARKIREVLDQTSDLKPKTPL
jgi:signal transduction histidine kinase/HAMP domain-containing protein/ActR/RegA family two-component response regulator